MTETVKPQPGSPEYDAAMIAKAETGGVTASHKDATGAEVKTDSPPPAPSPEKPARPDHIPEKFWDAEKGEARYEEMAKAYAELEKKLGKPADEKKADEKPADEKPAEDAPAAPTLADLEAKASAEFAEKGELSPETIEAYEKAGVSRQQIDTYVNGVKAIMQLRAAEAMNEVGGPQAYEQMLAWGNQTYDDAEKAAFNEALHGESDGARLAAMRGLKARYEAEHGRTGHLVKSASSSAALSGEIFQSRTEMTKAMQDARYKADPAYRAEVARKILNSSNAGIDLW